MSKKLSTILIVLALVLTIGITLTACNDKDQYPIPEDITISVEIYDGETLLGTVTKDTLADLTQEKITMTTTNSKNTTTTSIYVCYSFNMAAEKLGISLPAQIISVKSIATDGYNSVYPITSLENSYITIGFEDDGKFAADENGPRFISDKTSDSSNSIAKFISKIIINPVAEEIPGDNDNDNGNDNNLQEILAYTLTPVWSDGGRTLTVTFIDGDKSNIIILSTPEESAVTVRTIDGKEPENLDSNLFSAYENESKGKITTYYGYKLDDIIANMGKNAKSGWMSFVGDYTAVKFVCTDDEASKDNSARAYTKAEVEGGIGVFVVSDNGTTRIFSGYEDTDPATYRNKLKMVSEIQIYAIQEK